MGSLRFCSPDVAVDTPVCGRCWGTVAAQEVGPLGEESRSLHTGFAQGQQEPWLPPPVLLESEIPRIQLIKLCLTIE